MTSQAMIKHLLQSLNSIAALESSPNKLRKASIGALYRLFKMYAFGA